MEQKKIKKWFFGLKQMKTTLKFLNENGVEVFIQRIFMSLRQDWLLMRNQDKIPQRKRLLLGYAKKSAKKNWIRTTLLL